LLLAGLQKGGLFLKKSRFFFFYGGTAFEDSFMGWNRFSGGIWDFFLLLEGGIPIFFVGTDILEAVEG